ncbi:MAG: hypothetical protein ACJ740_09330 [Gaiellales bacterium]|jgi:hypothetical protein|nr:hypothetical protein [Gaiellales bacterium]HVG89618.1 hypothetical protein [Gaiellales bacterium]
MTAAQLVHKPRGALSEAVEAWRLHVLLQAGYPLKVAERLARSDADLHRAVHMLNQGCAPSMAERILV